MKKLTALLSLLIIALTSFAQAPEGFKYQAVAKNGAGTVISNGMVGLKFDIKSGSPTGTVIYSETHATTSNVNGVINVIIGNGSVQTGVFSSIDWGNNSYYFNIEMDPNGGTSYTDMGTTQFLTVPYAMYAKTSGGASLTTYSVGDQALGGTVFYVNVDGTHGLVAASGDQSVLTTYTWYETQDEVSQIPNYDPADSRKYSDWRVPTIFELGLMYQERIAIGGFTTGYYWSSVEDNATDAGVYSFNGFGAATAVKTLTYNLRAVRTF